jgi:hypothetical protein
MTNTAIGIGVRRMIYSLATPQYRNYDPHGGQLYNAVRSTYEYQGVIYDAGQTIPFDGGGGTFYTNDAQLERDFNAGLIDPAS